MSKEAVNYYAELYGSDPSRLELACAPKTLLAPPFGPIDIHTARHEDELGIGVEEKVMAYMGIMANYIAGGTRRRSDVLPPVISFDKRYTWPSHLMKPLLGERAKTGKITDLLIEAVAPNELPPVTLSRLQSAVRKRSNAKPVEDLVAYQRILGEAMVGRRPAMLACGVVICPFVYEKSSEADAATGQTRTDRYGLFASYTAAYPKHVTGLDSVWEESIARARII
jgi:hypothetical protein